MHQGNLPLNGRLAISTKEQPDSDHFIDLERLLAMARRQAKTVAIGAAAGLLLGIVYLLFATSIYTASTSILLDDNLGKLADDVSPAPAAMQGDTMILSQIAILKSTRLARTVVDKEKLVDDEVFMNPPQSLASRIKGMVRSVTGIFRSASSAGSGRSAEDAKRDYAAALLQRNLSVERQGRSFVMDLSYKSNNAALAGRIARAYADAYLSDQLDANFDATQRATVWLQGRLTELKESSKAAALEVEAFRAANGLTSANGALISEQQLSDLNSQLILAQADTAKATALYDQYQSIVDSGPENAVRNASVTSGQAGDTVIGTLRTRYLAIAKRENEISSRFGEDHPQAVSLRAEEQDVTRQIFNELKQMTSNYRNQVEVAKSRETSLRENLAKLVGDNSDANQSLVKLRELEQNAAALSNLYQTYLTRYQEATQQRSFPIAKARVISEAGLPTAPSSPKRSMALAFAFVLGIMGGAGIGALREFQERFFRIGDEVKSLLGVRFLGYLPLIDGKGGAGDGKKSRGSVPAQSVGGTANMTRLAVDYPASSFAETLRNAKIAVDVVLQGKQGKVVGIISALPHEGKSTVAANFAAMLAANGSRTLLIDADLKNPGLTRSLSLSPQKGLVEAIVGDETWQSLVKVDSKTRLAVIPAIVQRHFSHTSELLSCPAMKALLEEARRSFDYIIVDLPPLAPVVDAKAFAPLADGFVMVAEWGATPRALVRSILQSETQISSKMLGVILNKADMKMLGKYSAYGSAEQFLDRYSSYYIDEAGLGQKKPKPA
ncbi:MAG: polysaccharide biosynthesis tyrosine autokinase [Phyllobacterium sp.]